MKAVQISKPGGEFEVVQRETPEPSENQVRIKILACGVCHGDAMVKNGGFYPGLSYPRIPGHEVIGIVDKLGKGVNQVKPGQRVGVGWPAGITYDGGYAEYMITSPNELISIPKELNSVDAAPLLCAGTTTFTALMNSGAKPGDIVAINGIGGLGHLGIQYAKKMGFKTIAISRGVDKKELSEKLGAQLYLDSERDDVAKELQKLGGAKVILATAPNSKMVSTLVNGLTEEGKLLIIAGTEEPIQISSGQLISGRRSIQGWRPFGTPGRNIRKDTIDFSQLTGVQTMIETFPLEQINTAFEKMMNAKVHFRAVLTTNQSDS